MNYIPFAFPDIPNVACAFGAGPRTMAFTGAADPARDSKRGVLLRCPFGVALVATDPRTGDATLRLTYR